MIASRRARLEVTGGAGDLDTSWDR
jgi:hypothetical protein